MPLNVTWPEGGHSPTREAVAFNLMVLGYSEITKKNWERVYSRQWRYARVAATTPFTRAEILDCIGLRVNVAPMSETEFGRHLLNCLEAQLMSHIWKMEREE